MRVTCLHSLYLCVQAECLAQNLVFANCIPLILKFLNQNLAAFVLLNNKYAPPLPAQCPLHQLATEHCTLNAHVRGTFFTRSIPPLDFPLCAICRSASLELTAEMLVRAAIVELNRILYLSFRRARQTARVLFARGCRRLSAARPRLRGLQRRRRLRQRALAVKRLRRARQARQLACCSRRRRSSSRRRRSRRRRLARGATCSPR